MGHLLDVDEIVEMLHVAKMEDLLETVPAVDGRANGDRTEVGAPHFLRAHELVEVDEKVGALHRLDPRVGESFRPQYVLGDIPMRPGVEGASLAGQRAEGHREHGGGGVPEHSVDTHVEPLPDVCQVGRGVVAGANYRRGEEKGQPCSGATTIYIRESELDTRSQHDDVDQERHRGRHDPAPATGQRELCGVGPAEARAP